MISRALSSEIDGIKFRTAFKTNLAQGIERYAAVVMPIDLKTDAFIEDCAKSAKLALSKFINHKE